MLTPRWKLHAGLRTPAQDAYYHSQARFNVNHSGRRSGKSEIAKMRAALFAMEFLPRTGLSDGLIICGAPTHTQARNIFWRDMVDLIPPALMAGPPREGAGVIRLIGGTEIKVVGMDVAARSEGRPIDYLLLDEYGNMKPEVWGSNLRPALSTPGRPFGRADFVGVPEGRNHFYNLAEAARADTSGDWKVHHWWSETVVDPREIEAAKRDLDPLTYEQEYRGSFVSFQGRVYYQFDYGANTQVGLSLRYNPEDVLNLCFDFNRKPGVAIAIQEMDNIANRANTKPRFSGVIGEVYIANDSNTEMVCMRVIEKWGRHVGEVRLYGDASGGNHTSSSVSGSDWEIIRRMLNPVFGGRMSMWVPSRNCSPRARINAVNSRLRSLDGTAGMLIDPQTAPYLIKDLEGVRAKRDGSGDIDKDADKMLTHSSDAMGYYVERMFPIGGPPVTVTQSY